MANRWRNSARLYFLDSKSTADDDCSHEIKRRLLLGRSVMIILDNRDITLPTKVHIIKALIFPVVTYGCESWIIKEAEHQRIDAFEMWCWRRLLRVPWTAKKSNQSILKEINPGCSLEGLMLKLKLQSFGLLKEELTHLKRPWCWERLRAGREGDNRGWDGGGHQRLDGHGFRLTLGVGDGWGGLVWCGLWSHKESDMTERLNWTELNQCVSFVVFYNIVTQKQENLFLVGTVA